MKRFTAVACVLILSIASLASADTKKGRGSVNKPMIVTWRGNGPTQITVQVKQAKQPLMLVLGDRTEDITWCTSVGHSTRDRVIRCDFNAVSDSYALAVGAFRIGQLRGYGHIEPDRGEPDAAATISGAGGTSTHGTAAPRKYRESTCCWLELSE